MKGLRLHPNNRRYKDGRREIQKVGINTAYECLAGHTRNAHNGTINEQCNACKELLQRVTIAQEKEG